MTEARAKLAAALSEAASDANLVVADDIRSKVRRLTNIELPHLVVLGYGEIEPTVDISPIEELSL